MREQHLGADKHQDERQAIVQVVKSFHHAGQGKVHGTQAEDGEDIRGVDDEGINGNGQDGGDGIGGEEDVGGFYYQQHNQQRCSVEPVLTHQKLAAHEIGGHRHPSPKEAHHPVFGRMHFHFLAAKELGPRVNQESAKQVDDPIEAANQAHAHHDEDAAHDERAQYAPEKHLVLLPAGNAEIAENQQEDEQIINAEGELDQVRSEEHTSELQSPVHLVCRLLLEKK